MVCGLTDFMQWLISGTAAAYTLQTIDNLRQHHPLMGTVANQVPPLYNEAFCKQFTVDHIH